MPTKPSSPDELNTDQAREASPFFSLPNEDGSNIHSEYGADQSHQRPITLSCAHCERIVGDSSAFLFATRQMGTLTLGRMVSVAVGVEGLKTSLEGEWDEFCNYKDITCGKCTTALGKMYYATTSKLSALQNKYTLYLTALSFYHHASSTPSLPIAATAEIYAQLHPSPEAVAENIDHIMTICVMLREEQGDIIRELKKLGAATGVDIDLEDGGTSGDGLDARDEWKDKVQALDGLLEKVKALEEAVGGMKMKSENEGKVKARESTKTAQQVLGEGEEVGFEKAQDEMAKVSKESRKKKQSSDAVTSDLPLQPPLAPRRQEKKAQRVPPLPPAAPVNTRKRKSVSGDVAGATGKQIFVDLSNIAEDDPEPRPQQQIQRKSKKEVPNSQSAVEEDTYVEVASGPPPRAGARNNEEYQVEDDVEEEEEIEEERIKSPAEKRRKGLAVSIVYKKETAGRRISQGKKGYK